MTYKILHVSASIAENMALILIFKDKKEYEVDYSPTISDAKEHLFDSVDCVVIDYESYAEESFELIDLVLEKYPKIATVVIGGKSVDKDTEKLFKIFKVNGMIKGQILDYERIQNAVESAILSLRRN